MHAYPAALRTRIVAAVERGVPQAELARPFLVSPRTINRYLTQQRRIGDLTQQRRTGDLTPGRSSGMAPTIGPSQAEAPRAQVAAYTDGTLAQPRAVWARQHGVRVSVATMSRVLRRHGITVTARPSRRRAGRGPADGLAR